MVWGSLKYLVEAIRRQGDPVRISLPHSRWRVREMRRNALKKLYPHAVIETTPYPMDAHVVYSWER